MKFVDEFRNQDVALALARRIAREAAGKQWKIMEVCGGHTHAIYKYGIEDLLPPNVELVHGPGCPVCVIPMGRVDDGIAVARTPGVIFTCFGDMMRVPGSSGSLLDAKAQGADVRMVYSPLDALKIARQHPDREVVFYAIGFETTAPSTALTLLRAAEEDVQNFSVFCNHVMIIPPIKAILDSPDLRLDILQSVHMLIQQVREGRCEVENQYTRIVRTEGNPSALEAIRKVFKLRPHFEWRGLGFISLSALAIREEYARFDAELRFEVPGVRVADPKACQCGEVLKGVLKPWECKVFGTACTPETPIGTCMVSSEGACAAYYNFGRFSRAATRLQVLQ